MHMEIKFIPKAPAAAAGNQDSSLQELPVLRLKRAKKDDCLLQCCVGRLEMCMALQRGRKNQRQEIWVNVRKCKYQ